MNATKRTLAIARATVLGGEHARLYPDTIPLYDTTSPSAEQVLLECQSPHKPSCECEDCEAITDAYYDGWVEVSEAELRQAEKTLHTLVDYMIREHTPTGEHSCRCKWTSKSKTQTAEFHRAGIVASKLTYFVEKVQDA